MSTDLFKLNGEYSTKPLTGNPSGEPNLVAPILEQMSLQNKAIGDLCLDADGQVAVPLGTVVNANVVIVKTVGGKVTLRATSADGALQAIPIDPFGVIISASVPFTALTVERVAGVETIVNYFLGEQS